MEEFRSGLLYKGHVSVNLHTLRLYSLVVKCEEKRYKKSRLDFKETCNDFHLRCTKKLV